MLKRTHTREFKHNYKISYLANGEVLEDFADDSEIGINKVGDKFLIRYDPNNPTVRLKKYNVQSKWAESDSPGLVIIQ